MPERPRPIIALLIASLTLPALAQRQPLLDLGAAPQAPAPGQGAGALALAEDLRKQADDLARKGTDRDRAMAAVRRLAQTLLTTGESMGPPGSQRILIARTLCRGLSQIDRVISSLPPATADAQAALITRDIETAIQRLTDTAADPWRATRDSLALLTKAAQPPALTDTGWIFESPPHDDPLSPDIAAWTSAPGIPAGTDAALKDLDTLTQSGLQWAPYRSSARHTRATIRDAAALLTAPPAWLPEGTRRSIGDQFGRAITKLTSDQGRDSALATLHRLARLSQLIARVDSLEDSPALKRIRTELAKTIEQAPSDPTKLADESARLLAFDHALELAQARAKLPDEKALVRQARPPWRTISSGLKPSELKLIQSLPEILSRADAMTDPGIAATMATHRRAIQDLQALAALSAAMSEPAADSKAEPTVAGPWKLAADRLFKLGQDLSKPATHDEALTNLRDFATQAQDLTLLPGETALRDSVRAARLAAEKSQPAQASIWAILTANHEAALLSEISDRRGTWLAGWDRAGYAGSPAEVTRLRTLRDLMTLLDEASNIIPTTGDFTPQYAALQSWPGWDLSPEATTLLLTGLSEQLAEATRLITAGDATACAKLLVQVRKDHAAALLAARLAREATRRGVTPDAPTKDSSPAPILLELATGGPNDSAWLADQAPRLAEISRYAEEAVTARKLGAKDRAESLLNYMNAHAVD